jgi:hypothetical protein
MEIIFDNEFLELELIDSEAEKWKLLKAVRVLVDGHEVIIPPGFITDFGSVPEIARWLIEKYGIQAKSYLLHDWSFATEFWDWTGVCWDIHSKASENRALCDQMLLNGMIAQGVSWWKRNTIYGAVRCFGGRVWDSHLTFKTDENRQLYYNYKNSQKSAPPLFGAGVFA